jgi:hypothetical protein
MLLAARKASVKPILLVAAGASNDGNAAWNEPGAAVNGAALAAVSTPRPGNASWNEPGREACN